MNLSNKTFKNNTTGEIVKVIDSFENIAVLENKGKADVAQLLNPDLYTEQIDVSNFFNNQVAYNSLADKIKNIPDDKIRDDVGNEVVINIDGNSSFSAKPAIDESAIIITTEEDERAELAKKYGVTTPNQNDLDRQNQAFEKILNPEEKVQSVEVNRENPRVENQRTVQMLEDPIITMFKNVKRSKDFSISLEIKNKIPRPDFIEMMEDSYNTSIIDFLAAEFTDNLIRNPHIIEDMIKQKIKEVVYGVEDINLKNDTVKMQPLTWEREIIKKIEPTKKPTTRKPRVKKETSSNG